MGGPSLMGGCNFDHPAKHLRHVEKDVLIPKIMREKARERCSEQVQGGASRWRKSKTWRSPSSPQLHQKYIYTWNTSYRTPAEHWQKTSDLPKDFTKCCKDSGILMVVKCRKENSALKECLTAYYNDPAFYEECKMEYLKEREEFRKTGIPTKKRLQKLPTSM
ncbi:COX assembly mitochondrial protein homolog isoform X7 [Orcinus orca]|uniref:COX assembly mitochondrial protein homolog isoform X7 n=2 Tax=Orcinus orca TaxID=9733 RepID=UPI00211312DE|nr:COX assembly mitochondrial protein homolog isoform X7 [Orcinus orca]